MKTIKYHGILAAILLFLISINHSSALTGVGIEAQATNVILNWQSATGKIFLIESRKTLSSDTQWSDLTNYFPAATNGNLTTLVISNAIQFFTNVVDGGGGTNSGPPDPTDTNNVSGTNSFSFPADTGFYRVFDVTPIVRDDFFTIDQDSSDDQLDIFQNDYSPNDDLFYISNLIPAQHGGISYSLDASTFQYTPDPGFYGVDSFGYSVTSGYGDNSSNATVTVFVNQTGNSPPTANDLIITLETNTYTASFNALTNSADPDGDTNILFFVSAPNLGTISTNANGDITYARNPNSFGDDAFTYIVTDGKGGYGVCNVKILQLDTDGDGMPDQWEMANGLDPATDDSLGDPDSDGLPNLAEFTLGTNPNIADNPLNLSSVTNEMPITGFAQLPIRGLSPTLRNPPITLYMNGAPAENSFISQGPDGQWLVNWDTTFLTNGDYQIQLECPVAPASSPDSITDVLGTNKTVQVYNPITFDKLTSQFTDFLLINATLVDTNDTFDVYLYDDAGDLLVYAAGQSAPNGQVSLYWDLTDGNGNQISFGNIQAIFTLHPPENPDGIHTDDASGSSSASHWFIKDVAGSIDNNVFSVAWGFDGLASYYPPFTGYRTECMQDGVINILGDPSVDSYLLLPLANIPYDDSAFRYDSDSDKETLLSALNVSRNFYWLGHGEAGAIMGNEDHSILQSSAVEELLGNDAWHKSQKHPLTNKHPYFLTILNGCETYSPQWAGAFGVDFTAAAGGSFDSVADYQYAGRAPRAFVGWTVKIGVPGPNEDLVLLGTLDAEYSEALSFMFSDWMAGYPLYSCVNDFSDAAIYLEPIYFQNQYDWKISGCYDLQRGK